jgi:hypothetical protein
MTRSHVVAPDWPAQALHKKIRTSNRPWRFRVVFTPYREISYRVNGGFLVSRVPVVGWVLVLGAWMCAAAPRPPANWSMQPLSDPDPPAVRSPGWATSPIDMFIQARLEADGLTPSPEASPEALVRRLSFLLTGLPPTPGESAAFVEAAAGAGGVPSALAAAADRYLASPHYGERWGRHWLDVARYADTAGESADYPVPQAYLYRNYVIDAFNRDVPYDRFLREQIAGDLLPAADPEARQRQVVATGFLAQARRFSVDPDTAMHQTIEDVLDTLGKATMGLSLSCARCHDHKFDPVSMRDYYALYGMFESTRFPFPGSENKKRPRDLVPLIPQEEVEALMAPFQEELAAIDRELADLQAERQAARDKAEGRTPAFEPKRTQLELLEAFRGIRAKRDALQDRLPEIPSAYAVVDGKPRHSRIQKRGEPFNLGEEVPRAFLSVLGGTPLPPEETGSGRRQLAEEIASPKNPLTARVMVNRIWQHHFGQGLVATPNDFGTMGQPPTHPELLDWLASRFIEDGWSVKKMHRRLVASATWRQRAGTLPYDLPPTAASTPGAAAAVPVLAPAAPRSPSPADPQLIDPGNTLLWSFPRRRLDAESIRDALLAVSGRLERGMGGAHPFPPLQEWNWTQHNPFTAVYETNRRSVYVMQQRIRRHPFFAVFDGADTNASTGARFTSTTPLQALFAMNDPFAQAQAAGFAERVTTATGPGHEVAAIALAHRLAYGRDAGADETARGITYLAAFRARLPADLPPEEKTRQAWTSYARALMGANEFLYLD